MIFALLLMASPPVPNVDCEEPLTQQEMNWCAHQEFLAADAELNAQWKVTAAQLKGYDKAYSEATNVQPHAHFQTLLDGQRSWLKYRDAHCASEGNMFSSGSMEPLVINGCKTRLTKQRTVQLGILIGIDG